LTKIHRLKPSNSSLDFQISNRFSFPLADHSRLVGPPPVNGSPRSSIRSNHSSKPATPPPNTSARNGSIIIDPLNVSPKSKVKELENNNSSKIVNKNNSNAAKMQQQMLQQLVDQQTIEKQKHMVDLLHASKGAEALGVLVQYLVYNVSRNLPFFVRNTSNKQWKFNENLREPSHKMQISILMQISCRLS
jgi:hypothetical protein